MRKISFMLVLVSALMAYGCHKAYVQSLQPALEPVLGVDVTTINATTMKMGEFRVVQPMGKETLPGSGKLITGPRDTVTHR